MILATTVKLVLSETPDISLPGVKINLYDRDQTSMDDYLVTGVTDEKGQVRLVFDSDRYTDEDDSPAWRIESLPDLYVVVYAADGQVALSTRKATQEDSMPSTITVQIPRLLAEKYKLIEPL
jgi:hypothetical protein